MALSLISFNYKTTPLTLRERLAVPASRVQAFLEDAREQCRLEEVMLVSTCNRVEFYFIPGEGAEDAAAARSLLEWMKSAFAGWDDEMERGALILHGEAALTHVFRVACSLESMVIGEPQILGQVKEGYQYASESRALGPYLNGLMQRVFHTAKRVRTETGIARFPVSVSYVAAELAGRIFDSLDDKEVLVVGAGEMAELVVTHLQSAGARRLIITNRTFSNAVALAEKFHGSAVRYEHLTEQLAAADIVVSSTGAQGYVIDAAMMREAARTRKGRPMFLIDIAVPRDVEPQVDQLSNVYCYDIDDLQSVADANQRERESEAIVAQRIVEEEVARFVRWKHSDAVKPVLMALRRQFAQTGQQELDKLMGRFRHLSERDTAALRTLVQGLVNKLLHTPSVRLKQMGEELNGQLYAEAIAELFALEADAGGAARDAKGDDPAHIAAAEDAPADADVGDALNVVPFRAAGQKQS